MKKNAYPVTPGAANLRRLDYSPDDVEDAQDTDKDLKENIQNAINDICADKNCEKYHVEWEADPAWVTEMKAHNADPDTTKSERVTIPKSGSKKGKCPKSKCE